MSFWIFNTYSVAAYSAKNRLTRELPKLPRPWYRAMPSPHSSPRFQRRKIRRHSRRAGVGQICDTSTTWFRDGEVKYRVQRRGFKSQLEPLFNGLILLFRKLPFSSYYCFRVVGVSPLAGCVPGVSSCGRVRFIEWYGQ